MTLIKRMEGKLPVALINGWKIENTSEVNPEPVQFVHKTLSNKNKIVLKPSGNNTLNGAATLGGTEAGILVERYTITSALFNIAAGRKIDPTFYSVIYGANESEDWTDPKVWQKANPSLGITVAMEKVKAACDSAKQNPGEENSFRQLRLNQWVKQSVRWMPMDKWDAC